ncbi:MAG: AAA family ATPase [Lentisphaeria bacterium]|nr:AAA family ATPase [Lentisphaeria bacterium]
MSRVTISFSQEWIDGQQKKDIRVIRQIEKWIKSMKGVSLKTSSRCALTVELAAADRENFLKDLAKHMIVDFGETEPWKHAKFSGDIAGLDLPVNSGDQAAPEKKQSDLPPSENVKSDKKTDSEVQLTPEQTLEEICSRVPIKHSRELEAYVRQTAEVIPMLQKLGAESSLWHQHLLMAVDAGYGRSEFLYALVRLYKSFGLVKGEIDSKSVREFILLPPKKECEGDGYLVPWDQVLMAAQDMNRSNSRNGISKVILYIDISAWQSSLTTTEGKNYLRRLNSLCGSFLVVFRVPFVEGHVLRETAEALNDILNVRTISVPPAPLDAMIDYARGQLAASGFEIADNAIGPFEQLVLREKVDDSFFGYKTMDKTVQQMIYSKALSNCRSRKADRVISREDFEAIFSADADDKPKAELKKMIGLEEVKHRISEVIAQIKYQKKLAEKGKKVARPAIHMVFSGSPGTGKTTVARIVARMMHQAGILRKGHLIEVKGRDLCGRYVGETAPKTSAICRDAYGSVLFIDEAYSLFRGEASSPMDYGREALDTLIAEMENHRDDLCVIMAGYKDEMDVMLTGNAGLRSRIPYEVHFPNYSRDELEKIFFSMLDGAFDYEPELKNVVHEFFAGISDETLTSKAFSNARFVRNLFERTWGKAAYRQSLEGGDLRILKSDLAGAMSDTEFKKLMQKNAESRKIGFGA